MRRRKDPEPYIIVFESEEALADYEQCNEILYGPVVSYEGYARAGGNVGEGAVVEWPVVATGPARPRRPRSDFTRWFRRARRG